MGKSIVVLAALSVVGCGSNAAVGDYGAFGASTQKLFCQHQVDCGFADAAYETQCEQGLMQGSEGLAGVDVSFDAGAAQRCLDALKSALKDCHAYLNLSDMMLNDTCKSVVSGKSPPGGPCPNQIECAPGAICVTHFDGQCKTSCEAAGAIGAACEFSNCVEGAFCDGQSSTCLAQLDEGAACKPGSSNPCKKGFSCAPTAGGTTGACRAPGAAGALCASVEDCTSGLICDYLATPSVCAPQKKMGEACSSSGDCGERLLCVHDSAGKGTCLPPVALGGSCLGEGCLLPYTCLNGACTAPAALGDPCPNKNCFNSYCSPDSGKCEPLQAAGAACEPMMFPSRCKSSLFCESASKTCQPCQ
jgi:hypothetical protein